MVYIGVVMRKYKLVRRGPKYCVRVRGVINTTDAFSWCRERSMSYHIKVNYQLNHIWEHIGKYNERWDYDFIFDKEYEATAFMLGYL